MTELDVAQLVDGLNSINWNITLSTLSMWIALIIFMTTRRD